MTICPRCGRDTPPTASKCESCGADLVRNAVTAEGEYPFAEIAPYAPPHVASQPPAVGGEDAALQWLIPVGRSPYAIAAGYLGLLSLAFCFLGPFAVVFGILAIRDMQRRPQLTGLPRAVLGIVLGLIGSLVLVFAAVALVVG